MRILIVKLGSIGDIVHTLPAVAAIKRALPRSKIDWVVEKRSAAILRDNPLLESLIEVDTKALRRMPTSGETLLAPRQQFRRLRASAFDSAIDFQGLLKSASIARLSRAQRVFGFSKSGLREPLSRFLLTDQIPVKKQIHIIEKNLALAQAALGIPSPEKLEFPLALTSEHRREAFDAIGTDDSKFAILNPGGGWVTKLWPAERFGRVADELWHRYQITSLVTFGPGETSLADAVISASRSGHVRKASVSLLGFVALAERASVYIGGDTGPTHLAIAAGAPVVGLFGPTEWWRNGSPFEEDVCVERTDIECRIDCHRRGCSNWICMDIDVKTVADAVGLRLERSARARGEFSLHGA